MRRFAYWLFPIIAIFIAIFVVVLLIEINPSAPKVEGEPAASTHPLAEDSPKGSGWIERFGFNRDTDYFYPVNDVTIVLDTNGSRKSSASRYRLNVPIGDSYELFCLRQELKHTDLSYMLDQQGDKMNVFIDSEDQNKLISLVAKLKTYQISATLSPFKED